MDPVVLVPIILVGGFLVLLFLGVPVGMALFLPALPVAVILGFNPLEFVYQFKGPLDNQGLMALFTFVALGVFMDRAGVAEQLVSFFDSMVGHLSGGLGITVVAASTAYGALTGSVTGTVASIGGATIPGMAKRGYPLAFAAAVAECAGILGSLIPPSIAAIIYGILTNTSIMGNFMASVGAGLIYATLLSITVYIVSRRNGYKGRETALPLKVMAKRTVHALPALLVPVGVLGGIYAGVASATEAGVVGTLITVLIGVGIYGMKRRTLIPCVTESFGVTAMIMLIMCGSFALSYLVAYYGTLRDVMALVAASGNLWMILIWINLILFVMGMFLEGAAISVLMAPAVHTLLTGMGMDPYWVYGFFTFNCMVGFLTPPVGTALFTASSVAGAPVESVAKASLPLFGAAMVTLALVVAIPEISTAIPRWMGL